MTLETSAGSGNAQTRKPDSRTRRAGVSRLSSRVPLWLIGAALGAAYGLGNALFERWSPHLAVDCTFTVVEDVAANQALTLSSGRVGPHLEDLSCYGLLRTPNDDGIVQRGFT